MEEKEISFKTAKLAHEKGFFVWAKQRYNKNENLEYSPSLKYSFGVLVTPNKKQIFANTQSLLQKWLRDNYNIHIIIRPFYDATTEKVTYAADVIKIGNKIISNKRLMIENSYEQSLEIALQESLKLIK